MEAEVPTGRFISDVISQEMDDVGDHALKTSVTASNSSSRMAYVSLNPDFTARELTRFFFMIYVENCLQRYMCAGIISLWRLVGGTGEVEGAFPWISDPGSVGGCRLNFT